CPAAESLTAGGSTPLHFADRPAALVEERRSRVVLGLDPDPAALWPEAVARFAGAGAGDSGLLARANTAEAVIERRRGTRLRRGQAPARLLRTPGRSRMGRARADRRDRARPRPARAGRWQAR